MIWAKLLNRFYKLVIILYKWESQIFDKIDSQFVPSSEALNAFNDFLVRQVSRAKTIIPTFKDHFDSEINLIIPSELQKVVPGSKIINLEPTFDGKYFINDNLFKGYKEEILDSLKNSLGDEIITNFNFTELKINNQIFKVKNRFKDFEVSSAKVEVNYRVTKIARALSDSLIGAINNLRLKVVYIWGEQDLLSFKISHQQLLKNNFSQQQNKIMVYDWDDEAIWITFDYLNERKTLKVRFGMNAIYQKINRMLNLGPDNYALIKNYLTSVINLADPRMDKWVILKLKTLNKNELNLYKVKDLKTKLLQAYQETLKDIRDELYFQQGISNVDEYAVIHLGKINELKEFKAFIDQKVLDGWSYVADHYIYDANYQNQVVGIYHSNYEDLITMGEWIKVRIEKTLSDRQKQIERQQQVFIPQEHLLPGTTYHARPRPAYNKQKYPSFNGEVQKN